MTIKSIYPRPRFYYGLAALVILMLLGHFWYTFFVIGLAGIAAFFSLVLIDVLLLLRKKGRSIDGKRMLPERFSNGDPNKVSVELQNFLPLSVGLEVIDELPPQFQIRNFNRQAWLKPGEAWSFSYNLTPVERGEYHFGHLNVFVHTRQGMVSRRLHLACPETVKVYPSFMQMRKFEIMAISDRLSEMGIKKVRKFGHQMEFDQIREYTKGDDIRTINWKATARRNQLMVNQYQDEKSQQIYSLVDMGRTMKMPFDGTTLLDYAINTSLVLSNIAMLKHDKAGLITFNEKVRCMVPARKEPHHLQTIMEMLYNQETGFMEHNLEALYATVRHKIPHRSLLVLYTNFESLKSARRELPFLRRLASNHLLMVVFFENSEIEQLIHNEANDLEDIYRQTIAEKFMFDKKLIVKELERNGIHAILSEPGKLTVATMNKYLEFKARGLI
ncbi:DUF58 domain-containing protein [Marinilabilia rubra]|uniref:DUF58 domain-containing protein n=1 Tax=Marinilabilia rubra TaxID=2162893 RepID=A0A2U2BDG4_9BACT|nr:DUF58 domain-containing protein [Marinilabilia rubra]PWE01114.1 DUF58 domain-containing protein [Marinilabilia rubra]